MQGVNKVTVFWDMTKLLERLAAFRLQGEARGRKRLRKVDTPMNRKSPSRRSNSSAYFYEKPKSWSHYCSYLMRQVIRRHSRTAERPPHCLMFPKAKMEERKRRLTHSLTKPDRGPKQFLETYELFI